MEAPLALTDKVFTSMLRAAVFSEAAFGAAAGVRTAPPTPPPSQPPASYGDLPSETGATFEPVTWSFDYARREALIPMRDGLRLHTVILVPGERGAPHHRGHGQRTATTGVGLGPGI